MGVTSFMLGSHKYAIDIYNYTILKWNLKHNKNMKLCTHILFSVLALGRPQFEGAKAHLLSRWGLDDYF